MERERGLSRPSPLLNTFSTNMTLSLEWFSGDDEERARFHISYKIPKG